MNNYNTKTNTNKNNQKNRTDTWKMRKKKKTLITLAIVAAIVIPIGIYTVSPLPATTSVPTEKPLSGIFMSVGDGFHQVAGNVKVVSLIDGSKPIPHLTLYVKYGIMFLHKYEEVGFP